MIKGTCILCNKKRMIDEDSICRGCDQELEDMAGVTAMLLIGMTMIKEVTGMGEGMKQMVNIMQGKEE